MATLVAEQPEASFKLNQLVFVEPRTGPNENKQGGVGRITAISDDCSTYSVKYILGGRENGVNANYISLHSFEESRARAPTIRPPKDVEEQSARNDKKSETKAVRVQAQNQVLNRKKSKPEVGEELKQEIIHNENVHLQNAPLKNEKVEVQIEKQVDLLTAKQQKQEEVKESLPDEELMTFNQALRQKFQSRDSITFAEALAILPDEAKSRRAIQILQDQNRIFVPESGEEIWTI